MQFEVGKVVDGVITGITKFGAFVDVGEGKTGLVHISEISNQYVNEVSDHLQNGQAVRVKILGENESGKLNLSIRRAEETSDRGERQSRPSPNGNRSNQNHQNRGGSKNTAKTQHTAHTAHTAQPAGFEDMLSKFMHASDEKLSGMRKQPNNRRGAYQKKGSYNK